MIAKHVVAMDAISAPWFAICATSTMEAFTLTAPPRTDLRATLRELFIHGKRREAHTKSVTSSPFFHAQSRNESAEAMRRAIQTRASFDSKATTHPITGVAATALDAENRAALRAVKSENVRTTTVSHYASTRACRFTPSFPPRLGRADPGRASAPQTDRASRVPAHRPMRGVSRASHDVRDERKRADDARRNRTKFTASFVPSTSIGVHRRRRVVASSIHPSDPRSNPASHSKFFLSHERSRTHPLGGNPASIAPDPCRSRRVVVRSRVLVVVGFDSSSVSSSYKMRAYLLATLERVAVVGAATATVLKEAMADMMMMCFGRCVRCVPIERLIQSRSRSVESRRSVGRVYFTLVSPIKHRVYVYFF